ncbi:MAG: HEAT repeat domain-containing protein, partial [Candidatus Omnitrophota bacterium]
MRPDSLEAAPLSEVYSNSKNTGINQNEKTFKSLVKKLGSWRECVRGEAIRELGELGDKRAVEYLAKIVVGKHSIKFLFFIPDGSRCGDKNSAIRFYAIKALGKIGGAPAAAVLVEALKKEEDEFNRRYIIQALGKIKDVIAVNPLLEILKTGEPKDEAKRLSYNWTIKALGEIGDVGAADCLTKIFEERRNDIKRCRAENKSQYDHYASEDRDYVKYWYDKFYRDEDERIFDNKVTEYKIVIQALGKIKGKSFVLSLIEILEDEALFASVRRRVIWTLRDIGVKEEEGVPYVVVFLENEFFHDHPADFIEIGKEAVPELIKWFGGRELSVRGRVSLILDKLNWQPKTQKQKVQYLIAKGDWNSVREMGKDVIPELVIILKEDNNFEVVSCVANILYEIGWQPDTVEVYFIERQYQLGFFGEFNKRTARLVMNNGNKKFNIYFRCDAAEFLIKQKDPAVIHLLIESFRSETDSFNKKKLLKLLNRAADVFKNDDLKEIIREYELKEKKKEPEVSSCKKSFLAKVWGLIQPDSLEAAPLSEVEQLREQVVSLQDEWVQVNTQILGYKVGVMNNQLISKESLEQKRQELERRITAVKNKLYELDPPPYMVKDQNPKLAAAKPAAVKPKEMANSVAERRGVDLAEIEKLTGDAYKDEVNRLREEGIGARKALDDMEKEMGRIKNDIARLEAYKQALETAGKSMPVVPSFDFGFTA